LRECGDEVLGPDNPADTPAWETPVLHTCGISYEVALKRGEPHTLVNPSMITTASLLTSSTYSAEEILFPKSFSLSG
jgi:hypothetical protein